MASPSNHRNANAGGSNAEAEEASMIERTHSHLERVMHEFQRMERRPVGKPPWSAPPSRTYLFKPQVTNRSSLVNELI